MRRTNIYVWTSVALALSVAVPAQAWPLVVPARDSLLVRVALPPLGEWTTLPTRDALPPSALVRRIQELLNALGQYRGEQHGRLDDDTINAIRTYQQRAGLDDDGRATEELAIHIEFTSRAIELGQRLEVVRTEQMRAAEQALLAQPETRALVARRPAEETADLTRDAGACFTAPTAACLLHEASESAKAVFDARFRDWVLGEIVAGLARGGQPEAAFDTASRLTDPRLIVVALRDIAVARAEFGQVEQALAVALVIPDEATRIKALTAAALAQLRAGRGAAVEAIAADVVMLARRIPSDRAPSAVVADAALQLARAGAQGPAQRLLVLAREQASAAQDRDNELATVAAAMVAAGQEVETRALLASLTPASQRPVLAALATASAQRGDVAEARALAEQIGEARYRVAVLTEVAALVSVRDSTALAADLFAISLEQARALDERPSFARSYALRTLAITMAQLGLPEPARAAADDIADVRLRAEARWAIGAALATMQDARGAEAVRERALVDTAAINSALDRTWVLCGATGASARAGDTVGAAQAFGRALEEARGITDSWARSQALVRVAATLGTLR